MSSIPAEPFEPQPTRLHLSPPAQPFSVRSWHVVSAADAGFDETRFVQPGAATLLSCSICQHAPKANATLLSCCGQSACAKCITEWGHERISPFGVCCPFCREFAAVSKDRGYADSLSLAVVKCKYAPCCRWEGPFAIATAHESGECEVGKLQKDMEDKLAAAAEDKTRALAEADGEVGALSAEVRAQERDLRRKDATIKDLENQLQDAREALAAGINDAVQRSYMIQAMLACPPHVLDTMHKALLPELPSNPRPSSAALCLAGARARSRSPRASR